MYRRQALGIAVAVEEERGNVMMRQLDATVNDLICFITCRFITSYCIVGERPGERERKKEVHKWPADHNDAGMQETESATYRGTQTVTYSCSRCSPLRAADSTQTEMNHVADRTFEKMTMTMCVMQ